jgi:hypothetical protein
MTRVAPTFDGAPSFGPEFVEEMDCLRRDFEKTLFFHEGKNGKMFENFNFSPAYLPVNKRHCRLSRNENSKELSAVHRKAEVE